MIDKPLPDDDRLLDLLATYATDSLSADEEAELKQLLKQADGITETEFETAAAAMHLAMQDANDSLSDDLVEKILADSDDFFEGVRSEGNLRPPLQSPSVAPVVASQRGLRLREVVAWVAAAAAIVFALVRQPPAVVEPPPDNPPPIAQTNEEKLEDLLELPDTIRRDWSAQEDDTVDGTTGDIVWNTDKQQGYMRIQNLQQNDPTKFCYQLWIFDENQEHPIDGGVFNIANANELIPIDAKIDVSKVTMFAITVEKPGGVVVSKKERIPLLAKL